MSDSSFDSFDSFGDVDPAPLLGRQQYVAEWDPVTDELRLTGTLPGPAGSFEMSLAGVEVVLDAADTAVVNSVAIAAASLVTDATRQALRRLLGEDVTAVVLIAVGHPTVRPRIAARGSGRGRGGVNREMARLVLATSTAGDAGLRAEERALADLEAAVLAHRLDLHASIAGCAELLHDSALAVAQAGPLERTYGWSSRGDRPASGGPNPAAVAATLCREAAGLITDELLRARLLHLIEPDEPRHAAAGAAAPAPMQAPPSAKRMRLDRAAEQGAELASASVAEEMAEAAIAYLPHALDRAVTADSLPKLIAGAEPTINRTSNDEYELRLAGWADRADGWWVRAYSGADRTPLAMVPMASDGADAVGRFLVTAHAAAAMVVDIVNDPAEALPPEQIATFRAAIAAGKRAGRLERLDRPDDAQVSWQRASELHLAAGDNWRGETAAALAAGRFQRTDDELPMLLDPVVADLLAPLG